MSINKKLIKPILIASAAVLIIVAVTLIFVLKKPVQNGSYISNVALGMPVSASSEKNADRTALCGNDGSKDSSWAAVDGEQNSWWTVDLGQDYDLCGSEIMLEYEGDIWKYFVEVSSDSTSWSKVADKTANTSSAQIQTDAFTARARYVRITFTAVPGKRASFCEAKVFGKKSFEISGKDVALRKKISSGNQNGKAFTQIDLGEYYKLSAIKLTFENSQSIPQYRVLTSLNNIDRLTVVDNRTNWLAAGEQTFPISNISARYIRIEFESESPVQVRTEVFGTPDKSIGNPKKILVIAPHPDDEALFAAGVIHSAILRGDSVKVAVVTNGDCIMWTPTFGQQRLSESAAGMEVLGLSNENFTPLGYPDTGGLKGEFTEYEGSFLYKLYHAADESAVFSSTFGNTKTYGVDGEFEDYHYQRTGEHGDYNRATFTDDLTSYIADYMPDYIYTSSAYDLHCEHSYLNIFVTDAVRGIVKSNPNYKPIIYESVVHPSEDGQAWPILDEDPAPLQPFTFPVGLENSPLRWEERVSVSLPNDMTSLPRRTNFKNMCYRAYYSQYGTGMKNFIKSEEIFWKKDFSNLAYRAQISASSESADRPAANAADGQVGSYFMLPDRSWSPEGNISGAWVQLDWQEAQKINRITLSGTPDKESRITRGVLTFSNGTSIDVGELPQDGKSVTVTADLTDIKWVRFTVTESVGNNAGVAEIAVF